MLSSVEQSTIGVVSYAGYRKHIQWHLVICGRQAALLSLEDPTGNLNNISIYATCNR